MRNKPATKTPSHRRGGSTQAASNQNKRGIKQNDGGDVILTLLPSQPPTNFYQPSPQGPGSSMLYLRWDTSSPPRSFPLEQTWADTGSPASPGYFVFLNAVPSSQDAAGLEAALRGVLPAPEGSGFVWANLPTRLSSPVQTLLKIRLNATSNPCVDGDTPLQGILGLTGLGFSDGSPVVAARDGGFITGFVVTYPPIAAAQPPLGLGVTLPMAGAGVGCVQYQGLINAFGDSDSGARAVKALVAVSMDPLHPVDPDYPNRNSVTYTGSNYLLTIDGNSGSIFPNA